MLRATKRKLWRFITCQNFPFIYFSVISLFILRYHSLVITVFTVFRLLTDFVYLYNYEFGLSLCKIVRSSVILLLPLFIQEILVAYKWHFIVNKMIYVTEVCSNQFIRYIIALQSPYMIALSLYSCSRDRWQFIDVQRSCFLELKVNNPSTTPSVPPSFILASYLWFYVNTF